MIEKLKDITISSEYFGQNVKLESILSDRINILYGRNGSGKSTIADAFRKYKEGNDCCLKLDANLTSEERKNIFIFDEQFIRKNLDVSDSDGLGAIVTIGEAVVRKEEEEKLVYDLEEANSEKDQWAQDKTTAEGNASILYEDLYKSINSEAGFTGRRKRIEGKKNKKTEQCDFLINFDTSTLTGSEDKSAILNEINSGINNLAKIADGNKINWNPNGFVEKSAIETANRAISIIAENIEKPELNDREKEIIALGGNYIQKTRDDILSPARDFCPLCHQQVTSTYRETLEETITRIEAAMSDKADDYKRQLDSILDKCIYSPDPIPSDVLDKFPTESKTLNSERKEFGDAMESLRKKIEKRLEDVFAPAIKFSIDTLNEADTRVRTASEKLSAAITLYNNTIDSKAALVADLSAQNELLAYLENHIEVEAYKKALDKSSKAAEKVRECEKSIQSLGKKLEALRAAQANTNGARLFINYCLNQIFMSKDRLELVPEDPTGAESGTYILKSNGYRVKPEKVSVGERNAIALAYFFASTFEGRADKERFLQPALYIIDDPISSFDQDNRAGILTFIDSLFYEIILGNHSSKILILTHDLQTVDNLKVISHHALSTLNNKLKPEQIHIIQLRDKKTADVQYEMNSYQGLLGDIYDFAREKNPESTGNGIGNKLRQLLESYAQFNYNSSYDFMLKNNEVLEDVPTAYRDYFRHLSARLVMNAQSHSMVKVDSINSLRDPFTKEDLMGISRAVLLFIYFTNPLHLKFLLKDYSLYGDARSTIESWESDLPGNEDIVKAREEAFEAISKQYVGKQHIVESDRRGNLHCGDCLIKGRPTASLAVGDTVTIKSIVENTNPATNRIYPAFVALWE